jgi:hypothetical protein
MVLFSSSASNAYRVSANWKLKCDVANDHREPLKGSPSSSVTQSFNTTSSMGRLTLNVLLSFAQFEREVIGERVRDKIAASKRKGIWVGGMVPLGYRAVNKKLEIVPEEADLVRRIFSLYIELGSVGELARALDQQGVKPKPRQLANGQSKAAERYTIGPFAHRLKNRLYVGEIAYRGEVHKGEHPAIVNREVFDRVHACRWECRQDSKKGEFTASLDRSHLRRPRQSDESDARQQERRAVPLLHLARPSAAPEGGRRLRSARARA